jgi:hypothetical protein
MMCVWQCSPSSTMIQRRPILWATAPVVPDPAKESKTRSPDWVATRRVRSKSFSGLGVSKEASPGKRARISFFEVRLLPASFFVQIVLGTSLPTSDR